MNTSEVAAELGTTARELRQFLRSPMSTFKPVGSGSRYEFKSSEMTTIKKRFTEWRSNGRTEPRTVREVKVRHVSPPPVDAAEAQRRRDAEVWQEEGDVVLPDIRDPRVLRRVRAAEAERVARLEMMLMAAGLHVTQWGNETSSDQATETQPKRRANGVAHTPSAAVA